MAQKENQPCCEKFKTTIGGQALIEGIMMRGPEKDAIVARSRAAKPCPFPWYSPALLTPITRMA